MILPTQGVAPSFQASHFVAPPHSSRSVSLLGPCLDHYPSAQFNTLVYMPGPRVEHQGHCLLVLLEYLEPTEAQPEGEEDGGL